MQTKSIDSQINRFSRNVRIRIMVTAAIVWEVGDTIRQQAWGGEKGEGEICELGPTNAARRQFDQKELMMKKTRLLLMLSLMVLSGCAESSALIKENSTSLRTDVYEELTSGATAPQGYVDLRVTATFKTHRPGIYSKDIHGTPDYEMLLNIDGQAVMLKGELQKENSEPMKQVDPEAGDGIRYRFSKNLRLKAGPHKVVVALPDDEIAVAGEITLSEGYRNSLVVEPIYSTKPSKRRPGMYSTTSFTEGISSLRLKLNGKEI